MAQLDNFTRANESPLNFGGKWTATLDWFGRTSHQLGVVSNQCVDLDAGSASSGSAIWTAAPTSADQTCGIVPGSTSDYNGAGARLININTANVSGYYVLASVVGATTDLYRLDNGVSTQIGSSGAGWAGGDNITISIVGSGLTALKNGSSVATATDSTYTATGQIGMIIGPDAGVGGAFVTSFLGTPFAAATSTAGLLPVLP